MGQVTHHERVTYALSRAAITCLTLGGNPAHTESGGGIMYCSLGTMKEMLDGAKKTDALPIYCAGHETAVHKVHYPSANVSDAE
jgi:hypothetical protein